MECRAVSRQKALHWMLFLGVFLFSAVYFLDCRPLILDNGDGWTYAAFTRSALPQWKGWNPGKVFPEVFLPLCAQFAVSFVKPLCGDYIWSITLTAGVVISLIIALYVHLFARLLQRVMKGGTGAAVLVAAAFFLFHFKSWMSPWIPGRHLFYSLDLNNTFNYVVPGLLNAILMLYLEQCSHGSEGLNGQPAAVQGVMLLLVYLAVFSNMFLNCILAVYAGVCLLENLIAAIQKKETIKSVLSGNLLNICILVLWCVCAFFELSGGRAGSVSGGTQTRIDSLKAAVWAMLDTVELMDDFVFYGCIALVAAGLLALLASRGRHETDRAYGKLMLRHAANCLLITVYLLLLGSVAGAVYMYRVDILFVIMVHVLVMTFCSAAYILKRFPRIQVLMPAAVFILGIEVMMGMNNFELTNTGNTTQHALDVNRNLVEQVVAADRQGLTEMTLIVPYAPTPDNFPYPTYMGDNMVRTLRQHRMIENIQTIHIQPDEDYHSRFGIAPGENAYSHDESP